MLLWSYFPQHARKAETRHAEGHGRVGKTMFSVCVCVWKMSASSSDTFPRLLSNRALIVDITL